MLRRNRFTHEISTGLSNELFYLSFCVVLLLPACSSTFECECTRYKKYVTGSSTSVTVSKIREKNIEAARKKCEGASDSASTWGKEEKLNCKLRQK